MRRSDFGIARCFFFTALIFLQIPAVLYPADADENTRLFLDGISHYKAEDFSAAVSVFSKIADSGVQNSRLFYNLGNAYLKKGDTGYAVLWYERALKLTPGDPDLKFNYAYALSQTKDEKEDKDLSIFRILFFWNLLGAKAVQWAAIVLNLIFWLIITTRMILKKKLLRMPLRLLLLVTAVFTLTAVYNYYEAAYLREGIILSPEVSVRSGLTEGSTQLFVLHAGTKVRIEKESSGFFRIYFSEGKIGWIRSSDIGLI